MGKALGLHPDAARGMENFRKASRRADLGEIEDREIDRCALLIGQRFRSQILVADHLLQSVRQQVLFDLQQFLPCFQQLLPGAVAMPLFG